MRGVKFSPGSVYITPGAMERFTASGDHPLAFLIRHLAGDWGEVNAEDWQANEQSLRSNLRLLSVYTMSNGTKFWVITEADRSATTFLLPEEY